MSGILHEKINYNLRIQDHFRAMMARVETPVDKMIWTEDSIYPEADKFAKEAVMLNMRNKGMSSEILNKWITNKLVMHIFKLRAETYNHSVFRLIGTTMEEFVLIAFFWDDLTSFSNVITTQDLSKILEAKTKLPKYFKHVTRKGVIVDNQQESLDKRMSSFAKLLITSSFFETKRASVRTLYMFFQLRLVMQVMISTHVKDTKEDLNEMSWMDVSKNSFVHVEDTSTVNSWYNIFRSSVDQKEVRFINGFQPSIMDTVTEEETLSYQMSNLNRYKDKDEDMLMLGMMNIFTFLSIWGLSMTA